MNYKSMYKNELARAAGVSSRTFERWLQMPYVQQTLQAQHIAHRQQLLPPMSVKFLCEHFSIDL